ncbi:MAG: AHH domain-containing protein [Burkholderiaceae bacterium]
MPANKKLKPHGIFEQPVKKTKALTLAMNRMASNFPEVNPYAMRNEVMREEETERVCEENGQPAPARRTRPFFVRYDKKGITRADKGYTYDQLKEDGSRDSRHCVTLANNLKKAGHTRYDDVDAHHIVAWKHPAADGSRRMLYDWSIAINDADNGVFLPASTLAKPDMLQSAVGHDDIHRTAVYYSRVQNRLLNADPTVQASGRSALQKMRADMLSGVFPVK